MNISDAAQIDGLSSPPPSAGTEDEFREFIDSNLNINESEVQDQGIDHSRMPLRDPYDGPSSPEIPTPEIPVSLGFSLQHFDGESLTPSLSDFKNKETNLLPYSRT